MKRKMNGHSHLTEEELQQMASNTIMNVPVSDHLTKCEQCSISVRDYVSKVFSPSFLDSSTLTQSHG